MFFTISKIFEFIGSPSHLALTLLALGAGLAYTRYFKAGRRLTTLAAALLLLMAFGPVGHMLAVPLETRFAAPPDDIAPPDGIVVLGGSIDEALSAQYGRASFNQAAERVIAPIELLRRYPKARLVFTGGSAALRAFDPDRGMGGAAVLAGGGARSGRCRLRGPIPQHIRKRAVHPRPREAKAGRALAARHLGDAHAARRRRFSQGRLSRDRLSRRFSHQWRVLARGRSRRHRLGRLNGRKRHARMARPYRLSPDGEDGRAVSRRPDVAFQQANLQRVVRVAKHDFIWPTLRLSASRRRLLFQGRAARPPPADHTPCFISRNIAIAWARLRTSSFSNKIAQVKLDRVDRDAKILRELGVGVARPQGRKQAALAQRQILQRVGAHLADVDEGKHHVARRHCGSTSSRRSGGARLLTKPAPPSCSVSAGAAGSLVPL